MKLLHMAIVALAVTFSVSAFAAERTDTTSCTRVSETTVTPCVRVSKETLGASFDVSQVYAKLKRLGIKPKGELFDEVVRSGSVKKEGATITSILPPLIEHYDITITKQGGEITISDNAPSVQKFGLRLTFALVIYILLAVGYGYGVPMFSMMYHAAMVLAIIFTTSMAREYSLTSAQALESAWLILAVSLLKTYIADKKKKRERKVPYRDLTREWHDKGRHW